MKRVNLRARPAAVFGAIATRGLRVLQGIGWVLVGVPMTWAVQKVLCATYTTDLKDVLLDQERLILAMMTVDKTHWWIVGEKGLYIFPVAGPPLWRIPHERVTEVQGLKEPGHKPEILVTVSPVSDGMPEEFWCRYDTFLGSRMIDLLRERAGCPDPRSARTPHPEHGEGRSS